MSHDWIRTDRDPNVLNAATKSDLLSLGLAHGSALSPALLSLLGGSGFFPTLPFLGITITRVSRMS